jgi:hypothetical protein
MHELQRYFVWWRPRERAQQLQLVRRRDSRLLPDGLRVVVPIDGLLVPASIDLARSLAEAVIAEHALAAVSPGA